MGRIARLTPELVNKIAAGEVVERPASVVKELAENALDAGARAIRIRVEDGGLSLMVVEDDGCGMGREDALLAIERHATSKLKDLPGLFTIETMGFRGEALAAIAAVGRFRMRTCEPGAPRGTQVELSGGGAPRVGDAAPVPGTQIQVEDLFFNVPARRKYMKRPETELRHVQEAVIRLALAHPQVAFTLEQPKAEPWCSPADRELATRVAAVLGPEVGPHLIPVEERRLGLSVVGVVASPELSFATSRGLYTFVNRRYVRDRGLNFAIQRALGQHLPGGRHPVAALFLEIDPREVDVNVHPQKLEVRFADPRGVTDAVQAALAGALRKVAWHGGALPAMPESEPAHYALAVEQFLARAAQPATAGEPSAAPSWPFAWPAAPATRDHRPPGYFSKLRLLGVLAGRHWICEAPGASLAVLDPHAVQERVRALALRDQLRARLEGRAAQATPLFSQSVELSGDELAAVLERRESLGLLGVSVERFGSGSVRVELEGELTAEAVGPLLVQVARALPARLQRAEEADPAIGILACGLAGAGRREPSQDEVRSLLARLDRDASALDTPHGRLISFELSVLELDRRSAGKS